jgi:hypothetical protein
VFEKELLDKVVVKSRNQRMLSYPGLSGYEEHFKERRFLYDYLFQ